MRTVLPDRAGEYKFWGIVAEVAVDIGEYCAKGLAVEAPECTLTLFSADNRLI
jgi:hypothetical protein